MPIKVLKQLERNKKINEKTISIRVFAYNTDLF